MCCNNLLSLQRLAIVGYISRLWGDTTKLTSKMVVVCDYLGSLDDIGFFVSGGRTRGWNIKNALSWAFFSSSNGAYRIGLSIIA